METRLGFFPPEVCSSPVPTTQSPPPTPEMRDEGLRGHRWGPPSPPGHRLIFEDKRRALRSGASTLLSGVATPRLRVCQ